MPHKCEIIATRAKSPFFWLVSLISRLNYFKHSRNRTLLIAIKCGLVQGNPYVSPVPRWAVHRFLKVFSASVHEQTSTRQIILAELFSWLHFPYSLTLYFRPPCLSGSITGCSKYWLVAYNNSQFKFMKSSMNWTTSQLHLLFSFKKDFLNSVLFGCLSSFGFELI